VPSTSTNFLYSLITMIMVGTILTFSLASYVNPLRGISEINKLKEVLNQVAAKAEEATAVITECDATLRVVVQLPLTIGDRDYWIQFTNDSSRTWLEGAFGRPREIQGQEYRIYLPGVAMASGIFEGRYGLAILSCSLAGSIPKLTLSCQE